MKMSRRASNYTAGYRCDRHGGVVPISSLTQFWVDGKLLYLCLECYEGARNDMIDRAVRKVAPFAASPHRERFIWLNPERSLANCSVWFHRVERPLTAIDVARIRAEYRRLAYG